MRARFRSWWQYIQKHWVVTIFALTIVIVAFFIIGYHVDWFGFNAYDVTVKTNATKTTLPTNITVTLPYKTLYDWLQLLIVPAFLAAGAGFFTWWSARTERQITKDRYEQDQRIAEQRYRQDQELALDKQREDLLQSYLDRMAELLLTWKLRVSPLDAEVRKVARTRTISTLVQLDGKRARTIFLFLDEAKLIEEADPIIPFEKADLSGVKWSQGNLGGFNLSRANLSGATLNEVNLTGANLNGTNLNGANLTRADLSGANLNGANLTRADLNRANLTRANLTKAQLNVAELISADLIDADLIDADLSAANLSAANLGAANLSGATLSTATLRGTNLSTANLSAATLFGANLKGARLIDADLSAAKLSAANLSEACLVLANLSGAKLIQANLSSADLSEAKLGGAILYKANLTRADLTRADLSGAQHLESACLTETILRGVTGLTPEQRAQCKLSGALVDEEATPLAPPAQTAAASSSQETVLPVSPSPIQAVPSVHVQEATSEVTPSQEHPTVEKTTPPLTQPSQDHTTSLSSSQEDTSPAPLLQENVIPSSPSQKDAS